ncbi:glycerate kinase [Chromobacterium subtsugae]|uniref:Glycerate kinase n=1 Tax=Chromobacterium subtsugae TaxID=251747 RepID=A0ABS7FDH9_9NEIS|nr:MULTISPECIES: glycerate kinase [Chromobacterium]KUM03643.1 hydroxypyruvate reductase [Chromobacterium subtsugae]KZE86903.1 hydroxypyruvate reductase [Chromobacterium sp. F49]MBW7566838.1 glycerate kinase [Chromobacterium subtsugae]MBW8288143.1 glycerate kinase [Chromobacterium subtsugae]WSE92821.1 glycerate kinase [Chromobacterium subtsugae]
MSDLDSQSTLRRLFDAAVASALPKRLVDHLPPPTKGRTVVVGAGKAAAAMARELERAWPGELSGVVATRYGHAVATERIAVLEAAHPVPDKAGCAAAQRILEAVSGLTADDLVICLLSGGGSALLTLPADGVSLADKQEVSRQLLACGAGIDEMNAVRKHLSAIKGGRLALACAPAKLVTLAISDVVGDDPAVIASGPTEADPSTYADARAVVAKYGLTLPPAATALLAAEPDETPAPGDARLAHAEYRLIATPQLALRAAAAEAKRLGLNVLLLGDSIEGEAREAAKVHAGIARQIAAHGSPVARPALILSGGETTVTLKGKGRGGRNSEFLLSLAIALNGLPGVYALAADTDGIDGSEDNAGAFISPDTLARAAALGVDAGARLADNDGYGFFAALGDLLVTGPTHTNVNDFRAILLL